MAKASYAQNFEQKCETSRAELEACRYFDNHGKLMTAIRNASKPHRLTCETLDKNDEIVSANDCEKMATEHTVCKRRDRDGKTKDIKTSKANSDEWRTCETVYRLGKMIVNQTCKRFSANLNVCHDKDENSKITITMT
jgi:hypothetical protein